MKRSVSLYGIVFLTALSAGFLCAYLSQKSNTPADITGKIASNLARELKKVEAEFEEIIQSNQFRVEDDRSVAYPYYVFENDRVIFWSDNSYVPSLQVASGDFSARLVNTRSESYLLSKRLINDSTYAVVVMMLQRQFPIQNRYLENQWNRQLFPSRNFNILDPNLSIGSPVCVAGECLFRISFIPEEFPAFGMFKWLSLLSFTLAIIFFLVIVYSLLNPVKRLAAEFGLIYLYLTLLVLRLAMQNLGLPDDYIQSPLFDPLVFASSTLNASLGDLLLNMLGVVALTHYVFKNYQRLWILKTSKSRFARFALNTFSSACILFASLFPFVVIQTLHHNSTIEINIGESLSFDLLRVIATLVILLSGIASFLFSHAFIRILASDKNRFSLTVGFLSGVGIFVGINIVNHQPYVSSLLCGVVYVGVVYALRLYSSLNRLSYATFSYLFVAIVFASINGAYAVESFSHKRIIENQFRFASNFLIDRDVFGEYLLHEASEKIGSDAYTQTRILSPFVGKESVRQKIRQFFLPSYFNKYDVEIYLFNSVGEPLDNHAAGSLSDLINIYNNDAYRTEYEGIYFIDNPATDVTHKYLMRIPIRRANYVAGYVIVELSLKKIIPENVYPELLVDNTFQHAYRTEELSYAVFNGKTILYRSGAFNYERFFNPTWLTQETLYSLGISSAGHVHIAQRDQAGKTAVVSTPESPFTNTLANFSFLFVLGLMVVLVMIFIQGLYFYFKGSRLFFSARIQLYLNLAFFIPLIAVSVTTLSLISNSSQQQLDEEYLSKSRSFGQQLSSVLNSNLQRRTARLDGAVADKVSELASLANLDANVYRPNGLLLASSQPLIFETNLLSRYINGNAFRRIASGDNAFIESEQVGHLRFFVAYAALRSTQTGKLQGILGIPFFQSADALERVQRVIFINILNIFSFVFIILLVLSYFVSKSLTFPLRFITESLRKTSLTKANVPLTWNAQDEIGMMVREYNSMLYKLSESKSELEQSQREQAWREIAQQVAHEIKNPLTPMKLTLQQLERNLQSEQNPAEKTKRAIHTLLSQVETLNDIASSFSGFAKMPEPVIGEVDLVALLRRTADLHNAAGEIVFRPALRNAFVLGDEQLLMRTFSNIIINGLQAVAPGTKALMKIIIEARDVSYRITFTDNGKGIEPQIAEKIFLPHFTTKKSGSGLGLAIARQAIELMKGRIWFETTSGKGTSFYIELPIKREE